MKLIRTGAAERLSEPREHCEVSVKRDSLQPANAQRRESVVVFQVSERALNCCAATVKPRRRRARSNRLGLNTERTRVRNLGYGGARREPRSSPLLHLMGGQIGETKRRSASFGPSSSCALQGYHATGLSLDTRRRALLRSKGAGEVAVGPRVAVDSRDRARHVHA